MSENSWKLTAQKKAYCFEVVKASGFTGLFNTKDHGAITLVIKWIVY